jgi:hypothetical protein
MAGTEGERVMERDLRELIRSWERTASDTEMIAGQEGCPPDSGLALMRIAHAYRNCIEAIERLLTAWKHDRRCMADPAQEERVMPEPLTLTSWRFGLKSGGEGNYQIRFTFEGVIGYPVRPGDETAFKEVERLMGLFQSGDVKILHWSD